VLAYNCKKTGDVVQRHDAIRDLFLAEAHLAGVPTSREFTLQLKDKTYRPDFLLPQGVPGLTPSLTAFDVVVHNNFADTQIERSSREDLSAAKAGEAYKEHKFIHKIDVEFIPIALEVTGGHVKGIEPLVHYLMRQKALVTGLSFAELTSRFWQRLSVTLQRHLGTAVQKRKVGALDQGIAEKDDSP